MSSYLRPRRGKKSTAIAQLTSSNPLKRGEVFFEVPDEGVGTGAGKIKMGDGTTAYADLPYFSEGGGGGGVGEDITISLPTSSWVTETISGTTYYVQNGAAAGATSSTVPVIVPIYSTDTEMEAYSNIIRVESSANILKFIAVDKPSVNLTVVAKFAIESTADLQTISDALGIEITQAEYDLLTPEQKAHGTYWITDGASSSVVIDPTLNVNSHNAVENAPVATAINALNNDLGNLNPLGFIGNGIVSMRNISETPFSFTADRNMYVRIAHQGNTTTQDFLALSNDNGSTWIAVVTLPMGNGDASVTVPVKQGQVVKITGSTSAGTQTRYGTYEML